MDRIAEMMTPHGFLLEYWLDPDCAYAREEFEPLDENLLVPRFWEQAIVTYADMASCAGERVGVEERIKEIKERYETDPAFKDQVAVRTTEKGEDRILTLAARVEALEQGNLDEHSIAHYEFLRKTSA